MDFAKLIKDPKTLLAIGAVILVILMSTLGGSNETALNVSGSNNNANVDNSKTVETNVNTEDSSKSDVIELENDTTVENGNTISIGQ